MKFPVISEYIDAILMAEDNLATKTNLRPVLNQHGEPVMSSGNFAVVFKMKDITTNHHYAVKCFTREQPDREQSYSLISETLSNLSSSHILHVEYLENELFVDSKNTSVDEFPILLMDWVEGQTLDNYISRNLNDTYKLQLLAYNFCQLGAWLMLQPFAHGDLKPDNILVRYDNSLVLVDYDGMYVPAMKGQSAREIGSPDYRHPRRIVEKFDEHIDDFSILSIALSLKCISDNPMLYKKYGSKDVLLLKQKDYLNIGESPVFADVLRLCNDVDTSKLLGSFMLAFANENYQLANPSNLVIALPKNDNKEEDMYSVWKKAKLNNTIDSYIKTCSRNIANNVKLGDSYLGLALSAKDNREIPKEKMDDSEILYLKKAYEHKNGMAAVFLAIFHHHGWNGLKHDYSKSFEYFEKAHEWGCLDGTSGLALCYYMGQGVKTDCEKTLSLVQYAARKGNPTAQFMYGYWFYMGAFDENGPTYRKEERNMDKAIFWLKKAAVNKVDKACHWLSSIYHYDKNYKNFLLAKYWGDKARIYSNGSRSASIYDDFVEEDMIYMDQRLLTEIEKDSIRHIEYILNDGKPALSISFKEEQDILVFNLTGKTNPEIRLSSEISPNDIGILSYRKPGYDFIWYYKFSIEQ